MANRANHRILLGCGLLCAAALVFAETGRPSAAEEPPSGQSAPAPATSNLPVASGARLAGDGKQTRFILDLDRKIEFRAFPLADPYRVVVDIPQVNFQLAAGTGATGRGLVKAFRYGLVLPGGSRIVFDLTGPAKIANSYLLDAANGQPPRLVLDLEEVDRTSFEQSLTPVNRSELKPTIADANAAVAAPETTTAALPPAAASDTRPLIVIDPGHGGIDNGTASGEQTEKTIVLAFGLALRDRIEKSGKYRVVMTRTDDTFIPLNDRVKVARAQGAALFVSIHADALPRREGDAQGATIYTLSDKASDAEAERLADAENKADAIGGVNLTDEPTEVADILIDLAQRETRTFSNRFAHLLMNEMKTSVRMHKNPLKSAGFRVLKAPDVPSVLVELGYVSNKGDLEHLVSESWRNKTVGSMVEAIDAFFAKRMATAGPAK
ncbi:N-acetylmuramoyl-L-alanine amidase [Bradyrhizobium macuxiense]|uniref:N-acetylmuramoyl-L-alanine amidase AmiA n=1 Tax=Bradyrhizobium macuxiense TaxID=1755647 RepID=A0A109JSN3_9BRAD|nr:N-acetylmuramoyl-L-alanine amidase [Bradyrhizobium macuxiense]KWV54224.1 N-acetylmuramoyl-L-alanine amidase [Bradyrhizobium macuxiense]